LPRCEGVIGQPYFSLCNQFVQRGRIEGNAAVLLGVLPEVVEAGSPAKAGTNITVKAELLAELFVLLGIQVIETVQQLGGAVLLFRVA
jgi:hypothetical protein